MEVESHALFCPHNWDDNLFNVWLD